MIRIIIYIKQVCKFCVLYACYVNFHIIRGKKYTWRNFVMWLLCTSTVCLTKKKVIVNFQFYFHWKIKFMLLFCGSWFFFWMTKSEWKAGKVSGIMTCCMQKVTSKVFFIKIWILNFTFKKFLLILCKKNLRWQATVPLQSFV